MVDGTLTKGVLIIVEKAHPSILQRTNDLTERDGGAVRNRVGSLLIQ